MNNLSNYDVKLLRDRLEDFQEVYSDPADIANFTIFANAISAIDELLAYREAQGKAIAVTGEDEISNMQATGLYLRAWPTDRQRNEVEGYTISLYAAPQLPAVPDEPTDDERIMAIEGIIPSLDDVNPPVIPDGWTNDDSANSALVMLDRIDTLDSADDARIEEVKRIIRHLAAAPKPE